MDPKEIRELIELISRSNFVSFELEGDGVKLKLVKQQAAAPVAAPEARQATPSSAPQAAAPVADGEAAAEPDATEASDADGAYVLKSPIVGTFYRSPSPDQPAFAEVGATVRKGQVLCIVEAMKVMNEIESEIEAEVLEVLVANGQPVEYGEPLFRLRPLA